VSDVLKAIDERKESKKKSPSKPASARKKSPRKKVIYDDFGEPLRVVWEE
jgi:hypothetical protein